MKRHRYTFECGHVRNANNNQYLSNRISLVEVDDQGRASRLEIQACPQCVRAIRKAIDRVTSRKQRRNDNGRS